MDPRVFVVMPFGEKEVQPAGINGNSQEQNRALNANFDYIYTYLVEPALRQAGCEPFRADREEGAGDIRTDMYFELITADFVVADISILNPNVFYELGIRHGVTPRGIFMIHAGWSKRPFDVAPDRTFSYEGSLFTPSFPNDVHWQQKVQSEAKRLANTLKQAIAADKQGVGSPVYKELVGLEPVNWQNIQTAKAKYFQGVLDNWRSRVRVARKNGYPGDILTLADDAPTRLFRGKLLMEAARGLIDLHRFDVARSVLEEVIAIDPTDFEAQCQLGLTLGRLAKTAEAEELLSKLVQDNIGSPEAKGLLGRVYKDMWRSRWEEMLDVPTRQQIANEQCCLAIQAIICYDKAQRCQLSSYYNGINVITLCKLLEHLANVLETGIPDTSISDLADLFIVVRVAALQALKQARQKSTPDAKAEQIWAAATLGELELIANNAKNALTYYREAASNSEINYFQLKSMLSQLRLFTLLEYNQPAVEPVISFLQRQIDRIQREPSFNKVVVASGHMIDTPDRPEPRFPPAKEQSVREQIAQKLSEWKIGQGDLAICGGARGTDILFAELCLERGARVWLFLALPPGDFLNRSVRLPSSNWETRFNQLRQHPQVVTIVQKDRIGDPPKNMSVFSRTNIWIINTARVEANSGNLYALIVWDEKDESKANGPGGTAHFATQIQNLDGYLAVINPTRLLPSLNW